MASLRIGHTRHHLPGGLEPGAGRGQGHPRLVVGPLGFLPTVLSRPAPCARLLVSTLRGSNPDVEFLGLFEQALYLGLLGVPAGRQPLDLPRDAFRLPGFPALRRLEGLQLASHHRGRPLWPHRLLIGEGAFFVFEFPETEFGGSGFGPQPLGLAGGGFQ